jgi:hypothetical protein
MLESLSHCPIVLLFHCPIVLLSYCPIVLLFNCPNGAQLKQRVTSENCWCMRTMRARISPSYQLNILTRIEWNRRHIFHTPCSMLHILYSISILHLHTPYSIFPWSRAIQLWSFRVCQQISRMPLIRECRSTSCSFLKLLEASWSFLKLLAAVEDVLEDIEMTLQRSSSSGWTD